MFTYFFHPKPDCNKVMSHQNLYYHGKYFIRVVYKTTLSCLLYNCLLPIYKQSII